MGEKAKYIISLLVLAGLTALMLPLAVWGANQLQNDGLEPPFNKYGTWTGGGVTFDLEVAHDWERFFIPGGTHDNGDDLRYFRASAVEFLFGFVEKRDGTDAQLFWSTRPYDAGIYQQVSGLSVGESYGFQTGVLQVYGNTTSKIHGKMFRSVGIDPYGGTDPTSSNVVWSPEEGLDVDWFYPGVGAQAMSSTVTVFVRVRSMDDAPRFEENSVWVDDAFFDIAPTTALTLTVDSPTQVTATWSGSPRTGFHLFAYEAQYRKSSESDWTDLQIFTSDTNPSTNSGQSFSVETGVEYIVRARTWHEQDNGDEHEVPGPWVEETITAGGIVAGKVVDNRNNPVAGATITDQTDPGTTTISNVSGNYSLLTGVGTFGLNGASSNGWATTQPVKVTVPDLETVVPLTITLHPPDNVISNGDFESSINHWSISGTTPATTATEVRSGSSSLRLSGNVTLSQTRTISGSFQPTLSFWYKLAEGDNDDTFTAQILGEGLSGSVVANNLTPTNSFSTTTIGDWQFAWLPLGASDTYTGPVGVRFNLSQSGSPSQTVVYLDEVSLGSVQQVSKVYLPLIFKSN